MSKSSKAAPTYNIPELIFIPAGPFWLGSDTDDPDAHPNEQPRQQVTIEAFHLGRFPVTNAQYAEFLQVTGHPAPWQGPLPTHLSDHPVVNVNFDDALAYCRWLSQVIGRHYRLPAEEEWEKAARGPFPEIRRYTWGDQWQSDQCNTNETGLQTTTPVTHFAETSRSPYDIVDLPGNVWEWTESWFNRYAGSTHTSLHFGRSHRVVRGGSWKNDPSAARISCRGRYQPDVRRAYLGFRVAADAVDPNNTPRKSADMVSPGDTLRVAVEIADPGDAPNDLRTLATKIVTHFNLGELRSLCFDLDINYENLPSTLDEMARELALYCHRRGRTNELRQHCQELRPQATW